MKIDDIYNNQKEGKPIILINSNRHMSVYSSQDGDSTIARRVRVIITACASKRFKNRVSSADVRARDTTVLDAKSVRSSLIAISLSICIRQNTR